jgi:hypothetical protein
MKRLSWRLTILAAALAACIGSASAQTTNCSGILAPGTYANLNVPANTTCRVEVGPVTVTGNVTVEKGASLLEFSRFATFVVNGSLMGRDAASIQFDDPSANVNILGSVHLTGTTGVLNLIHLSIGGTLFIANSTGSDIDVFDNNVGGSVLVRNNTISGPIIVQDNAIGGSLVCMGNTPAPTAPNPTQPLNTVGGNKVGQCASL